jgi:hypothetical protein
MFRTTTKWRSFSEEKPAEGIPLMIAELGQPYGEPPMVSVNVHRQLYSYNKNGDCLNEYQRPSVVWPPAEQFRHRPGRYFWSYLVETDEVLLEDTQKPGQ